MPTRDDEKILEKVARGRIATGPKIEVKVPVPPPPVLTVPPAEPPSSPVAVDVIVTEKPKHRRSLRPSKEQLKHVAENPWVRLVAALLVGGVGGEAHQMVRAVGLVSQQELEEEKKARKDAEEKLRAEINTLGTALGEVRGAGREDHTTLYLTNRYLVNVLPKLGVLVTLPPNTRVSKMEFHPAPLRTSLGPNDPKPIQPAETFPLPSER